MTHNLKVMQINIRGLKNKKQDLEVLIVDNNPDIICLNETLLKHDQSLKIKGFNTISLNRQTTTFGGGVMILIKDHIQYDEITKIHINRHEIVQCRLKCSELDYIYIASIYVPPTAKIDNEILETINKDNTIIVGDMNCKHLKWGCNTNGRSLMQHLYNNGLENINTPLNYKNIRNNTLKYDRLQQILTSIIRVYQIENVYTANDIGSDHLPMIFDVKFNRPIENKNMKLYHKLNLSQVTKILDQIPTQTCQSIEQIEHQVKTLQEKLEEIDKIIPRKEIKNDLGLPREARQMIKERRKLKNLQRRNKHNILIKDKIKNLNKTIKKELKKAKREKWERLAKEIEDERNAKKSWQRIKKIKNVKTKTPTKIIGTNGEVYKSNIEIANEFTNKLKKTFKPNISNKPILEELSNIWESNNNFKNKDSTRIDNITLEEIKNKINKLKLGKCPGIYHTTNKLLKTIINEVSPILQNIFNNCLKFSHFPSYYKIAKIIMIQKKPNTNKLDEFRPISLLPTLGKLLESLVCDRINTWIEEKNILNNEQSGFRKNRSTQDHVFQLLQSFCELKNRKRQMSAIFIDFEKAFDTINHRYLLYKLNILKIPKFLLNIISNFLKNRSCFVNYNGSSSKAFDIRAGVPQGSCLSPILFGLFVSDIPTNNKCNLSQFADDLAAWARFIKNFH